MQQLMDLIKQFSGGMGGMGGGDKGAQGQAPQGGGSEEGDVYTKPAKEPSGMDELDVAGNITSGALNLRPQKHEQYQPMQPTQLEAAPVPGAQGAGSPPQSAGVPSLMEALNAAKGPDAAPSNTKQYGYNEAQGQSLDDYAAEELEKQQRMQSMA